MVLALCVLVHIVTMIYAVSNGLSAAEILGRTRGNYGWSAFYALFVAALAVHAPIGLRTALSEMLNWRGAALDATGADRRHRACAVGLARGLGRVRTE